MWLSLIFQAEFLQQTFIEGLLCTRHFVSKEQGTRPTYRQTVNQKSIRQYKSKEEKMPPRPQSGLGQSEVLFKEKAFELRSEPAEEEVP